MKPFLIQKPSAMTVIPVTWITPEDHVFLVEKNVLPLWNSILGPLHIAKYGLKLQVFLLECIYTYIVIEI